MHPEAVETEKNRNHAMTNQRLPEVLAAITAAHASSAEKIILYTAASGRKFVAYGTRDDLVRRTGLTLVRFERVIGSLEEQELIWVANYPKHGVTRVGLEVLTLLRWSARS